MKCMGGNSRAKDFSGKDKAKFGEKQWLDYVLIDDDGDQLDDVVIIDGEFAEGNLDNSGNFKAAERYPSEGVINIDDDEDDSDGNPGVHKNTKPCGNTSSSQRCPSSNFMWRSVGFYDDDCQVIHEKKSVFGFSKCRRAEHRKPSHEKGYGFIPESMSSSSSDCEVIEAEDVPPKLEKTLKRRKFNATSSPMDQEDHKGASATHSDKPPDIHARSRTEDWGEGPVCSNPDDSTYSETCSSSSPEINNENIFYKDGVSCTSSHNDISYGQPFSREAKDPILESIFGRKHFGASSEHLYGDGTIHSQTETVMDREKFKETDEYKQAAETEWESRKRALQLQAEEVQRLREIRKAARQELEKMRDKKDNEITDEEVHGSEAVYNGNPKVMETPLDSMGDTKKCGRRGHHSVRCDESETIIGREKLKESEEYKKAMEAEWMARQQQIILQAQEAQRLRRKKQAEKRILDMERRQKERVEEMREMEKKDKENMDMKEQLRIEVRKNLSNLDSQCSDMASLLRGLGVHVAEGSNSSSPEVHAAYKRALLKFHPDRASRSDIRQQVEAEEKFKLISRMKDKYLSA